MSQRVVLALMVFVLAILAYWLINTSSEQRLIEKPVPQPTSSPVNVETEGSRSSYGGRPDIAPIGDDSAGSVSPESSFGSTESQPPALDPGQHTASGGPPTRPASETKGMEMIESAPELSGTGPAGSIMDSTDAGAVVGLPPEAGELDLDYSAPEDGVPQIQGPAPEASDPGVTGPAPEDSKPPP